MAVHYYKKKEFLNRFAGSFMQLQIKPSTLDEVAATSTEKRVEVHCLSEPPDIGGIVKAIDVTRDCEALASGKLHRK